MERLIIAGLVVAVALVIAWLGQRRNSVAPVRTGQVVPEQVDRSDFDRPDSQWLVAVFTDASCSTCAKAVDVASALESSAVAVQTIERSHAPALHQRYTIHSVPTTLVVDSQGVVRGSFLGPPRAADLWAAVADLRD
ncbi:MAG: hypothetical protein V3V01_01260 [Acidimicrobiales bacterium]